MLSVPNTMMIRSLPADRSILMRMAWYLPEGGWYTRSGRIRSRNQTRGAKIYAEVTGFGCSFNQGKAEGELVIPDSSSKGTVDAINAALTSAGITADQLDLIITHGCGIPEYDKFEALAIKEVTAGCSEMPHVLATKSRFGVAGAWYWRYGHSYCRFVYQQWYHPCDP